MNKVRRELIVESEIEAVWEYVKDMGNWASQMPGYLAHETVSTDDSLWTLQVNFGPFSRPVPVDVHVTRWLAPTQVDFEVKGHSDPFIGIGSFVARREPNGTAIALEFGAEGTGSMAKMITAMIPPVLNYVGDGFAANLARELQSGMPAKAPEVAPAGLLRRLRRFLAQMLGRLLGRGKPEQADH